MGMSDIERRAYQRGYQRGAKWPEHKPPIPPDQVIGELVLALRALRDACDSACATFFDDDPVVVALDPAIEKADDALRELARWLKTDNEIVAAALRQRIGRE